MDRVTTIQSSYEWVLAHFPGFIVAQDTPPPGGNLAAASSARMEGIPGPVGQATRPTRRGQSGRAPYHGSEWVEAPPPCPERATVVCLGVGWDLDGGCADPTTAEGRFAGPLQGLLLTQIHSCSSKGGKGAVPDSRN